MKICVFGDSYADEHFNKDISTYKSWIELLREKYYPELTCYGISGSALYFSYDLFLTYQNKFDKIIFIMPPLGRIGIPSYIKFKDTETTHLKYHINSIETAEFHLTGSSTTEGTLATKAVIEYYKYLYDPIQDARYYDLMKNHIKKIRDDVVMIDTISGLADVSYYEVNPSGFNSNGFCDPITWKYRDYRRCHLSKKNNEILADKMVEWCNGAPVHIDVKDFEVTSKEELSKTVYLE